MPKGKVATGASLHRLAAGRPSRRRASDHRLGRLDSLRSRLFVWRVKHDGEIGIHHNANLCELL